LKSYFLKFYNKFISLKGEPEHIAMGFAMGVFIGFTPTIPFHTTLVSAAALLFRQNLTAACLGSWVIPNPFIAPFFYFTEFHIGKYLLGIDDSSLVLPDFSVLSLLNLGWNVALPLLTGGIIIAICCAIPSYFIALKLITFSRKRRGRHGDHP
jgi:uncharacterized protein (TIGR03546 family)